MLRKLPSLAAQLWRCMNISEHHYRITALSNKMCQIQDCFIIIRHTVVCVKLDRSCVRATSGGGTVATKCCVIWGMRNKEYGSDNRNSREGGSVAVGGCLELKNHGGSNCLMSINIPLHKLDAAGNCEVRQQAEYRGYLRAQTHADRTPPQTVTSNQAPIKQHYFFYPVSLCSHWIERRQW